MASKIKNVLLEFSEEEHRHLKEMKKKLKLSWEGFMLYLFHSHLDAEKELK
jgi:hypothetical protein